MRKYYLTLTLLFCFLVVLLGACTDRTIVTDRKEPAGKVGSTYGFSTFSLTIDTAAQRQVVSAKYDEKPDRIEAEYTNKEKGISSHGNKAVQKLEGLFEKMDLNPDMDEEDMVKSAAKAFGISDYKMLKLSIKFAGHDAKDMTMTK